MFAYHSLFLATVTAADVLKTQKKPGPTSVIKCTGTAQENQRRSHKKEKLKRKEAPLNRL